MGVDDKSTSLQSFLMRAALPSLLWQYITQHSAPSNTRCVLAPYRRSFYHGPGGATGSAARSSLTVRDAIAWASFCCTVVQAGQLTAWAAYAHGAYLTLLDGLGLGLGLPEVTARRLRVACEQFLRSQLPPSEHEAMLSASFKHLPSELGRSDGADDPAALSFGAGAFRIPKVRNSSLAPSQFKGGSPFSVRQSVSLHLVPVMRDDDRNERAPTDGHHTSVWWLSVKR